MFGSHRLGGRIVQAAYLGAAALSFVVAAGCSDDGHRRDYDRGRDGPVIRDDHRGDGYYDQQRDYDRNRGGYDHPGPVHPEGYYDDRR